MGFFKKLMPARQDKSFDVVADLDAMISAPIGIKLMGKIHKIKAMDMETFLKTSNGLARIYKLHASPSVKRSEVLDAYARLFSSCCDTISRKDLDNMTEAQIAGFFQQVINQVQGSGNVDASSEKKKP